MNLKKHSNGVYYAHLVGSAPVNLKTKDAKEARALAKAAKLEEIEFAAKAKVLTSETIARLTAGGKVNNLEALKEWRAWAETVGLSPRYASDTNGTLQLFFREFKLEKRSPAVITDEMVDEFVNPDSEVGVSTRNSRKNALQSYFQFCQAKGYSTTNPTLLVRVKLHGLTHEQKEHKTREPFTDEEVKQLKSLDDPFWKAATWLSYETGLRIGDIACLEWGSLSKKNEIVVWMDKRDKRVALPLPAALYNHLTSLPKDDKRFVFPEAAKLQGDPKRRANHSTYFSRILKGLGIEGKSFHSMRHTFATRHARHGATIDEIRIKMGHESTDTTEGYIHK